MAIPFSDKERVLKNIYGQYLTLKDYWRRSGNDTIDYGPITISVLDLQYGIDQLPARRKEAFWLHVVSDMTQADAGKIMGITPVTVGQYVQEALQFLADRYFAHDQIEEWVRFQQEKDANLE